MFSNKVLKKTSELPVRPHYWAPRKAWTSKRDHLHGWNWCQLLIELIQACQPVWKTWPIHRVQVPWPEDSAKREHPDSKTAIQAKRSSYAKVLVTWSESPRASHLLVKQKKGKRESAYFSHWGTEYIHKERRNLWQPFLKNIYNGNIDIMIVISTELDTVI